MLGNDKNDEDWVEVILLFGMVVCPFIYLIWMAIWSAIQSVL